MDENEVRAQGFKPYRKIVLTYARQIPVRFSILINTGERLTGRPGDYICYSPGDSSRWVVERDIFQHTYTALSLADAQRHAASLPRGLIKQGYQPYIKHQVTWARRLDEAQLVHTIEGDVRAEAGDYLCIGPAGEMWPQAAARFEATYRRVEEV